MLLGADALGDGLGLGEIVLHAGVILEAVMEACQCDERGEGVPLVLGGLHQLVGRLVLLDGAWVVLGPLVEVAEVGMAERDA